MTPAAVPAPGSPEALRQGCTCQFVEVMTEWLDEYDFTYDVKVSADCPLHGVDPLPDLRMRPRVPSETCIDCGHHKRDHDSRGVCQADGCGYVPCKESKP